MLYVTNHAISRYCQRIERVPAAMARDHIQRIYDEGASIDKFVIAHQGHQIVVKPSGKNVVAVTVKR